MTGTFRVIELNRHTDRLEFTTSGTISKFPFAGGTSVFRGHTDFPRTKGEIKYEGGVFKLDASGSRWELQIGDVMGVELVARGALAFDGKVIAGFETPTGKLRTEKPATGTFAATGTINRPKDQITLNITLKVTADSGPFK
jgi:hypothetical protein